MGKRLWMGLVLALGVGALGGCFGPGYEQRFEERLGEKITAWEMANPGKAMTEAEKDELKKQAIAEIKVEIQKEYGDDGVGVVTSIASGNWLAAAFLGIGMVGNFLGLRRRKVSIV